VVGRLPYRGYFDPAEAEAVRLRELGLDVIARPASTPGLLTDAQAEPPARHVRLALDGGGIGMEMAGASEIRRIEGRLPDENSRLRE